MVLVFKMTDLSICKNIDSFFNSKESKFKVNVLKLNKTDKIRNFDIYEI